MVFIIIALLAVTILFIRLIKVNRISKNTAYLYSFYTFGILAFSTFNLYKLDSVSNKVYLMWIANIILVVLSVLICSKKQDNKIDKNELSEWVDKIAKSKILFYTGIALILLLVFYKIRYNNTIQDMELYEIRKARFGAMFSNGVETIFFDYILMGILTIFLIIGSILIVNKKILNRITLITIISVAIYSSIGYGRMTIFEFAIFIVLSYLIFKCRDKFKISIKTMLILAILAITLLLTGSVIVVIRLKGMQELNIGNIFGYGIQEQLDQIYRYFTGGFRTFEHFLENGFDGIQGNTIARLTFGGMEDLFGLLVNNIGFKFTTINSIIAPITQTSISVGDGIYMNAFYTCLMNYYCDLGYVGIVIYPILHGALIAYSINNYIKKNSILSYILMIYVMYNMIASIYRWNYQGGATMFLTLSIIICDILWNHRKNKGGKYENTLDS